MRSACRSRRPTRCHGSGGSRDRAEAAVRDGIVDQIHAALSKAPLEWERIDVALVTGNNFEVIRSAREATEAGVLAWAVARLLGRNVIPLPELVDDFDHDHERCAAQLMVRAERACARRNARLTSLRRADSSALCRPSRGPAADWR